LGWSLKSLRQQVSPPFPDNEGQHERGVSVRSERALQGGRIHSIDLGGGNRPIDDVLKCGNYDLLADRGIYVERVRETLFVPASGMAGSRRLQGRGGNHETTR
jgi:hypothetical protein